MPSFLKLTLLLVSSMTLVPVAFADSSKFQFDGKIMIDVNQFDGVHKQTDNTDSTSRIELRRAKLNVKYRVNEDWKTKVQLAVNRDDEIEIKSFTAKYTGLSFADITLGKFKEPFSLEYLISASELTSIERSAPTSAFALGYQYGVSIESLKNNNSWQVGIFDARGKGDSDNAFALTARGTQRFIGKQQHHWLHLGISASLRQGGQQQYRINERAEVYSGKRIIKSSKLHADTIEQISLESIWNKQQFSLQGELFHQSVKVKPNMGDADSQYAGYYLQASYRLSGEPMLYKKSKIAGVIADSPSGAWELTARYSYLDAMDNDQGSKAKSQTIGVNYYVNQAFRVMLNLQRTELEGNSNTFDDTGKSASFRLQWDF